MKFSLPFACPSPLNHGGLHWTKRRKIQERCAQYVFSQIGKGNGEFGKRQVVITIYRNPAHAMDRDNAYASVKPLVDAIKKLVHLRDDSEEWLELTVNQRDAKKRSTEVEITEVQSQPKPLNASRIGSQRTEWPS